MALINVAAGCESIKTVLFLRVKAGCRLDVKRVVEPLTGYLRA